MGHVGLISLNDSKIEYFWCIDLKSKKRKLNEPTQSKPAPQKRVAIGTAMSTKPAVVKKETKPVAAVKDAKADFSFFSAPKPKAKLPSFKKAAVPTQLKKHEANVALPSSFDPFQEALKSMKARIDSPALSTPPAASASTPPQISLGKNGKKKKCVTWATDEQLVSIRLIERAIYDDDPVDVSTVSFYQCVYNITSMTFSLLTLFVFFFSSGFAYFFSQHPRSRPGRRRCTASASLRRDR